MASFRNAHPSASSVMFMLALLICKPMPFNAQLAQAGPLVNLGQLSKLLQARQGAPVGGDSGAGVSPAGIGALLGGMSPFNPFGVQPSSLPPFDIANISDFTQNAFQALTAPAINYITPEPLSPEMQELLRNANGNNENSAEAVATLALLSPIFLLVSAILFTVAGALGTAASSLAMIPAGLATVTGPIGFALAADSFAGVLRTDFRGSNDRVLTNWNDALTNLADRLGDIRNGNIQGNLGSLRSQLAEAKDLLQSAAGKFAIASA